MRLRITRKLRGSIDGLRLWPFEPGHSYEVGTTLGNYLLAIEAAEPVIERCVPARHDTEASQDRQTPMRGSARY